jgi:hypothetical protein
MMFTIVLCIFSFTWIVRNCKGENTSHYGKHHIQHLSIIHTSSYNHIKHSVMYFLLYLDCVKLYEVVELYDVVDVDECIYVN